MITQPKTTKTIISMNDAKLQKLLKATDKELRSEPGFTDDFTGELCLNVTQGGLNKVIYKKHKPVRNSESEHKN